MHPSGVVFDVHEVVHASGVLVGLPNGDVDLAAGITRILPSRSTLSVGGEVFDEPTQRTVVSGATASSRGPGMPAQIQPSALALRRAISSVHRSGSRHFKPTDPGRTGYTPPNAPCPDLTEISEERLRGWRIDSSDESRAITVPCVVGSTGDTAHAPYATNFGRGKRVSSSTMAEEHVRFRTAAKQELRKPPEVQISSELQEKLLQASIANAKMKLKAVELRTTVSDAWINRQKLQDTTRSGLEAIRDIRKEIASARGGRG